MQNFPIMAMKPGDRVTVHVNGQFADQGTVCDWDNHGNDNGGWVVTIKSDGGDYRNYWVRQGASFSR